MSKNKSENLWNLTNYCDRIIGKMKWLFDNCEWNDDLFEEYELLYRSANAVCDYVRFVYDVDFSSVYDLQMKVWRHYYLLTGYIHEQLEPGYTYLSESDCKEVDNIIDNMLNDRWYSGSLIANYYCKVKNV